ncbi:hypothetical protein N7457_005433 [Penicillium paradoxum]|uniref:uncharacterized protein n=1 Tax=Penicillium paradoxum TaxID=176176 RepID=UPI0025495B8E|nr:uncharacterized protein N7457_005433 [Penicillium paradoxum]KAJ5780273.1 hypothetical protein N7457_005433 [Penicillium paradoxum]
MAPPGIEPGLTQKRFITRDLAITTINLVITTMCRHTTRPWHRIDIKGKRAKEQKDGATRNRTGANTENVHNHTNDYNHNVSSYH